MKRLSSLLLFGVLPLVLELPLTASQLLAAPLEGLRGAPERLDKFDPSKVKVLVKFKNEQGRQDAKKRASKVSYESNRFKIVAMEVDSKQMLALENNPNVEYVDLDLEVHAILPVPEEEVYSSLDSKKPKPKPSSDVRRKLAEEVPWGITRVQGGAEFVQPGDDANLIKVCIVDTGYNTNHEDLPGTDTVSGSDYTDDSGELWDVDGHGHGTHCKYDLSGTFIYVQWPPS